MSNPVTNPIEWSEPKWPARLVGDKEAFLASSIRNVEEEANGIRQKFGLEPIPLTNPRYSGKFDLMSAKTVTNLAPLSWRIRNVLPLEGIAAIYGLPGTAKSFLVLDLLLSVNRSKPWFGNRTIPCPVVYLSLEGEAGLSKRLSAYTKQHGKVVGLALFLIQPFSFLDPKDVDELAKAINDKGAKNGIVAIDTLNRAAPGIDENTSADMGNVLVAAKRLQTLVGGLVVLVHHSGKDATKGLRGHSSLLAALDAAIEVSRDGSIRTWRVAKSKDGEDGICNPFRLEVLELGLDEYGDPVTSCVIAPQISHSDIPRPRLPKGGNQKIIYEGLRELLRKSDQFGKGSAHSTMQCIEIEDAILKLKDKLIVEADRKTERTRHAITSLIASGLIQSGEGWLWIA